MSARKRVIDWDVDGLAVWCDAPSCTNRERCASCELAYESEQLDYYQQSNPMVNRAQGAELETLRQEMLAEAAQLDALAMQAAPCVVCGLDSEVTREQAEFGETPRCVECGKWDARAMRGDI